MPAWAEPGIRELVIGGTPYVILYRVRGQRVIISTIWHGAQRKELWRGALSFGRGQSARRTRHNGRPGGSRKKVRAAEGGDIGNLSLPP
jgi:hypothetical protein